MSLFSTIDDSWKNYLAKEFNKDYLAALEKFLDSEILIGRQIYPKLNEVFTAFNFCAVEKVKVVILGQDPYHGAGQAHGLAFSVQSNQDIPPSLKNIFKEISNDIGISTFKNGNLSYWAEQGVLLMNAVLTVEENKPGSHQNKGWEQFTDAVIGKLSDEKNGLVFILWGNYARKKKRLINDSKHLILEAAHPSPLSAYNGFFNCNHFSKTNEYLKNLGKTPIDWDLNNSKEWNENVLL